MRAPSRTCASQLSVFDVSEKMPFGSNKIEEQSAVDSFLITSPKNEEVLNACSTIRQRLPCEGADMDAFFTITRDHTKQH